MARFRLVVSPDTKENMLSISAKVTARTLCLSVILANCNGVDLLPISKRPDRALGPPDKLHLLDGRELPVRE